MLNRQFTGLLILARVKRLGRLPLAAQREPGTGASEGASNYDDRSVVERSFDVSSSNALAFWDSFETLYAISVSFPD